MSGLTVHYLECLKNVGDESLCNSLFEFIAELIEDGVIAYDFEFRGKKIRRAVVVFLEDVSAVIRVDREYNAEVGLVAKPISLWFYLKPAGGVYKLERVVAMSREYVALLNLKV